MLRWLTAGESHGPSLTAVIDGLPAGIALTTADLDAALARRRLGFGRGARQRFERDEISLVGGVRHGQTFGAPIAISIANAEWSKWQEVMAADPVTLAKDSGRAAALTRPRPGHADLAGMRKYGLNDIRPILERASARETAARVALGEVAKQFLRQVAGIEVISHVIGIGKAHYEPAVPPTPNDLSTIDADRVRAFAASASALMVAEIEDAQSSGDTLGGTFEILAYGLPIGLGSHVQWDRRLDARLASAMMSIQAIKAVEIGDGFAGARRRGSEAHDEIEPDLHRATNRSGGTEGGISTGEVLRVRAAMKPISTVPRALRTVDLATGEPATAIAQRSDACAVPAAAVIGEAMMALVIAEALLEKFGGDHVAETRRNLAGYVGGA